MCVQSVQTSRAEFVASIMLDPQLPSQMHTAATGPSLVFITHPAVGRRLGWPEWPKWYTHSVLIRLDTEHRVKLPHTHLNQPTWLTVFNTSLIYVVRQITVQKLINQVTFSGPNYTKCRLFHDFSNQCPISGLFMA